MLLIGDALGWTQHISETVNQLDAAKAGFLALSDCLIVFDNVERQEDIKDYLPKTNLTTHILITSRYKQSLFHQIDLDILTRDEARELLLKVSNHNLLDETEKDHLEKILDLLDGIPLAIELVGGYLAEHENITFAKYHQFLNDVPLDRLEKEFPGGSFTDHDRSIIRTLRISEKLIKEKPLMVEILKVLAWSGNSSMGTSLLKALVEPEDDFEFETAIGDAQKLCLLKKDDDANRYAIHRLLAKVIRHENPLEKQKKWHEKIVNKLENWFNARENKFEHLVEFESEIEHLKTWQEQTLEILPEKAVVLIQLRRNSPHQRGLYQEAFNRSEEALNLYQKENLTDKNILAILKNDLGSCYGDLGNHEEALKYKLQSLEISRQLFGEQHPDTATSLNDIGFTYGNLGNHQEALKYKLQSLEIFRQLLGEQHPYTVTSLNNVGNTYSALGNHEEALKCKLQALQIHRELLGKQHPVSIIFAKNLIDTYRQLQNFEEVKRLTKEYLG